MRFPKCLYRENRKALDPALIKDNHSVYIRHKPGVDWSEQDGLPDFNQIKIDGAQSCNWCAYSIPIWTRFDNQGHYKPEYAVVGYSVKAIRDASLVKNNVSINTLSLAHKPEEMNYSHCEFEVSEKLSKSEKRALRLSVKNNSKVHIKPNQKRTFFLIKMDIIRMRFNQLFT